MKEVDSILVILDKPKHAQTALARAGDLAGRNHAHLHLVSFCWLPMVERSDVFDTHQRRAIRKSVLAERRGWLDALVLDRGLSAADVSTEVVWTDDIAGWVADQGAAHQLILKSVHHSKTLLHTPLDWALLRRAPVPLWLASTRRRRFRGRVLATVDVNSRDAAHRRLNGVVLDAATTVANWYGAPLHVMSAVQLDAGFEEVAYLDSRALRERAREATQQRLQSLLSARGTRAEAVHVPEGKVGHCVAATAAAVDADVLVVGTGTHGELATRVLGSSAEKILQRVSCDVLAVHL